MVVNSETNSSIHSQPELFRNSFRFYFAWLQSIPCELLFLLKKNKNNRKKTKNERKKHICSIETFNDLCERMEKKFKTQVQFCMQKNAQCTQHNHCNETLLWSTSRFHHLSKCLFFIFYSFSHQLFHFPCLLLCDIAQFKTSAKSRPHQFAYYFSFVFVCVGVRLLFRMFSISVANDKFSFSLFFSFVLLFPTFFSCSSFFFPLSSLCDWMSAFFHFNFLRILYICWDTSSSRW